jgi:hypothetical protein
VGLNLSIRSSVIGRLKLIQAGYFASCDGLCVAKGNGATFASTRRLHLAPATWPQCRGDRSKRPFSTFAALATQIVARDSGIGGVLWSRAGITSEAGGIPVLYKNINLELIAVADEADAVVVELNAVLDRLEEKHALLGGGIETVAFEHSGTRKRSALAHTIAAGETVAGL